MRVRGDNGGGAGCGTGDGDGDGYRTGWWQYWGLGPVCASEEGLFEGADFLPQRSVLGLAGTELGSNGINQAITFCDVSLESRYVLWVCFDQLRRSQKGDYLTLAAHSEVTGADFVTKLTLFFAGHFLVFFR